MYDTWRMTAVIYQLPNSSTKPAETGEEFYLKYFPTKTSYAFFILSLLLRARYTEPTVAVLLLFDEMKKKKEQSENRLDSGDKIKEMK